VNGIKIALPGAQPDWMMMKDERERKKGVYVTLETKGHDKKATEMPMLMVRKWLKAERWEMGEYFFCEGRSDGPKSRNEFEETLWSLRH
jgi:hypothetical protein